MLLVKKSEGWYNIYNNKVGIGSTHPELQGYKLSQKNCDEIFGVVDVEKLFNEVDETIDFHEFCFSSFKLGFNKAMRLNKDKQFTRDDVITAIVHYTYLLHNDGKGYEDGDDNDNRIDYVIASLKQKPTEIEVEIEMRTASLVYKTDEMLPKLDEDGCIILKKILKK